MNAGASQSDAAPDRPAGRYLFIDWLTQGYLGLVGLAILLFHGSRITYWGWLVLAHAAGMVVVHLLVRAAARFPRSGVLDLLRHFYPLVMYLGFYRESTMLGQMFIGTHFDHAFLRLDEALFGFQPSIRFMEAFPTRLASELFYGAYFSYYVMIVGVGLALYLQSRERFFHYVSVLSLVFYVCYLTFALVPVIGPRVLWASIPGFTGQAALPYYPLTFPPAVERGFFFAIMKVIYHHFEGPGGAFPSSHVAAAVCTLVFSWRFLRPIRWLHLVMVVLLSLSTVYCRYHYAVDVPGGLVAAAILIPFGERLYQRLG